MLLGYTEKSIEDYLNWKADRFLLDLEFSHLNKEYQFGIEFDRNKKSTTKELKTDDGSFYKGQDTLVYLASLYDFALCKTSVFSLQGELDMIYASPAERREILKKVYDLDFSKEIEDSNLISQSLEADKVGLDKQVYHLQNLSFELEPVPEYPCTKEQYETTKALRDIKLEERVKIDAEYETFKLNTAKVGLLTGESIVQAEILRDKKEALQVVENEIAALDKKEQAELSNLQLQLDSVRREIDSFPLIRIPAYDMAKHLELQTEEGILKEHINLVAQGKCPTCARPFVVDHPEVDQERLHILQEQLQEFNTARKLYQDSLKRKEEVETLRRSKQQQEATLQTTIAGLPSRYTTLKERNVNLQTTLRTEIVKMESESEKLKEEFLKLKKEVEGTSSVDITSRSYEVTKAIDQAKRECELYEKVAYSIVHIQESNAKKLKEKEECAVKTLQAQATSQEFDKQLKVEEQVRDILKREYPNFCISRLISSIEKAANDFLSRAYEGRYTIKIQETKAGLEVVYGERDKSVVLASGAEKSLVNTGLKIGFAKLSGLGLLLLDEIDSFMSTEVSEEVFRVIGELIEEGQLNQVFIISHNDAIKELLETQYNAHVIVMEDGEAR